MNPHVLVIEDDEDLQKFLSLHLEDNGFKVSVAGGAQEAFFKFVDLDIDLVLLDLGLPDRDGMDVLELIRKKSRVPVVILTARRENIDKLVAMGFGANAYLGKPVDPQEVILQIRNLLDPVGSETGAPLSPPFEIVG